MIVGIDYSITCPTICLMPFDDDSFSSCKFLSIYGKKAFSVDNISNIEQIPTSEYDIERFKHNAIKTIDFIQEYCVYPLIVLEDYAFAGKGKVFNIAENCGILKLGLYENGLDYITIAPTAVKKFATGKGNANKNDMLSTFEEQTGIDLFKMLNMERKEKIPHPIEDIVDSYFMAKYGKTLKGESSNG